MRLRISALGFALRLRSSPNAGFFEILVVYPVLLAGGNANNGAYAGFAYSNVNNAPSNANANIGSQLSFYFTDKDHASWQKINNNMNLNKMKAQSNIPLPASVQRWKEGEFCYYYNHNDNGIQEEENEGRRYEADFVIIKSTEKAEVEKALTIALIDPEHNQKIIDNIEIEGKKAIDVEKNYMVTKEMQDEIDAILLKSPTKQVIIKTK